MKMHENTRYQYLRSRKRCACCGKQDARTLEGFEHCVPCAEKARIRYNQDYKEINKQKRILPKVSAQDAASTNRPRDIESAINAVSMPQTLIAENA